MYNPAYEIRIWADRNANDELLKMLKDNKIRHYQKLQEGENIIAVVFDYKDEFIAAYLLFYTWYSKHKEKKPKAQITIDNDIICIDDPRIADELFFELKEEKKHKRKTGLGRT